jgi:putative ABC transport system permease protein
VQELRYALRRLGRHRLATTASALTLAGAIAAATVTWTVVQATLLRPLAGAAEADRWFVAHETDARGEAAATFVYPALAKLREAGVAERVAATWVPVERFRTVRAGVGGELDAQFVTHDLLSGLGVAVAAGRGFTAADDRRGAAPVAILSDRAWRLIFDASPAVVGETLRIGRGTITIVGVAAPGFRGIDLGEPPDVFVPLHAIDGIGSPHTNYYAEDAHASSPTAGMRLLVRLPAGAEGAAASRVATVLAAPPAAPGRRAPPIGLTPLAVATLPAPARADLLTFSRLLAVTAGLLVLAGAAAVGALLCVRVEARRDELATCLALGAPARRLLGGLASEAGLVAAAGAVLSLPIAWLLLRGVVGFQLPGRVGLAALDLGLDWTALAAALVAGGVVTGLVTAVAALHAATRVVPLGASAPASATPRPRRFLRDALLAAQVAVALLLLAGAGVFVRSLQRALDLNPAVGAHEVLRAELPLPAYGYDAAQAAALHDAWRARLAAHPGVERASVSAALGGMSPRGGLLTDGVQQRFATMVNFVAVDDAFFATLRLPLLAGRDFSADDRAQGQPVAVVSASMARALAADAAALGRRIAPPWRAASGPAPELTVVGVVPDLVTDVRTLAPLTVYVPAAQQELGPWLTLTVRARADAAAVRREAQQALRALDPAIVPPPMPTLRERLGRQMGPQRLGSAVLGGLGMVALLLTTLSAFVLADAVATFRLRELGVRAALGASPPGLATLLLRETARPVAVGLAAGLGLAGLGARALRGFLFQVDPLDPATLGAVAAALLAVVVVASLRPAVRVSRLDVARVLRLP